MPLTIPIEVIYAGLAGTLLALLIATIQQGWSCRVFFLLALRLAIGWHFLFEGMYKIHSTYTGPTETSRPFTSEPYFKVAPGPIGAYMRKQFGDPNEIILTKVAPPGSIAPDVFEKMSLIEQAAACPTAVSTLFDQQEETTASLVKAAGEKILAESATTEAKTVEGSKTEAEKEKARADAEALRAEARKAIEQHKERAKQMVNEAKAAYARWVYGVDARNTKVKGIGGDVALTAPQRIEHVERLRREVAEAQSSREIGLGNGYGTEGKRAAEVRMQVLTAEADLANDAETFITDLQTELNAGNAPEKTASQSRGQQLDKVTMWFLAGVGACLMLGLFTRLACLLAAGFLVTTYLLHPPFPWYPLPPGTEGNPVFINKNVIECLALLVLMCYPSGRWLGLDAFIARIFTGTGNPPVPESTPA